MKPMFSPAASKSSDGYKVSQPAGLGSTNVPAVAKSALLTKMSPADLGEIQKIRSKLSPRTAAALMEAIGGTPGDVDKIADQLLAHSKASDISIVGQKMTDIVVLAKSVNVSLLNERSRVPLIGGWIDRMRNNKERVVAQFDSTSDQIMKIVQEVDTSVKKAQSNIQMLEKLYDANLAEYHNWEIQLAALQLEHEQIDAETVAFQKSLPDNPDPFDVQQVARAKQYLDDVSKAIANTEMMAMSCIQTAPQILAVQQGGNYLIDKFATVKRFTLPSWKKKFALSLTIDDNAKGAQLANMIDDANNEFARDIATKLKLSSVAAAKSSQRGVYDLATFEFVNSELIAGVDEVAAITQQGVKDREALSVRLIQMKQELQTKLS